MPYLATITSKRQFTIPADVFRQLNLKEGQRLLVSTKGGQIRIEPALALIERLAGSVKVPTRFGGLTSDQIIQKAKEEYFSKRR